MSKNRLIIPLVDAARDFIGTDIPFLFPSQIKKRSYHLPESSTDPNNFCPLDKGAAFEK